MPGTAFGFGPYPPRPSVPPRAIGEALARQNAPQRPQDAPGSTIPLQSEEDIRASMFDAAGGDIEAYNRASLGRTVQGAGRMAFNAGMAAQGLAPAAGPGFAPDATTVNVGRALGAPTGQQGTSPAPFSDEQLRRLGLPEMELNLLRTTGALR